MGRDWRECDEQPQRKSGNDGFSPYPPVRGVLEQMANRAQIPLLADSGAFNPKLPKKPPWHPFLNPLHWLTAS